MINDKKVIGLICECNPFHEGHKRIINEAKNYGDIIVAVMSGNFVQRGEPAVYDKYKRTYDLLKNSVDIVIELPIEYVLSSADFFADGAIKILDTLGFVDNIIFGSKINDITKLRSYAMLISKNDISVKKSKNVIRESLKVGDNYAKAIENLIGIRLTSNDILAVSYINAINKNKSKIIPICIKRKDDLKTASELRKDLKKKVVCNSFTEILNYKLLKEK